MVRQASGVAFEITGGDLCLDLANTREARPTPRPQEHLESYARLSSWGEQAGAISAAEASALRALAARRPRAARAALARAIALREAIFAVFSAVAARQPPHPAALAQLNAALPETLARLRLTAAAGGAVWVWATHAHLDRVLWPAVQAAARLLTSPELKRVRECAASDCAWLFLDQSRNASRRWCDMAVCGNREKARRFQRRSRRPR